MPFVLVLLVVALVAQQPASSPPPSAASSLDFEFFKTKVQPIFLAKRPGHARCVTCHTGGNGPARLQPLSPGATTWSDEESRKNFESFARVVVPGDPLASRMLMHPLAKAAGGDPFHAGGKHWNSQSDPEWQTLVAWVRSGSTATSTAGASPLDFQSFRARIEPIFLKARDALGGTACVSCHATVASRLRLQPLATGATAWTEQQSRQNFERVSGLVVPGDPMKSRLLLHPLATEAGGDPTHTGGKFWTSPNDPEFQQIAEWVRAGSATTGAASATSTRTTLDYDFFRSRVEPIFLQKRPGHARCVTCHEGSNTLQLQRRSQGVETWNDEQSRKTFEAIQRLVVPGDPTASRLLMHPLSKQAGGDPFHAGGKHWDSQNDPEWQTLAAWVRGQTASSSSR